MNKSGSSGSNDWNAVTIMPIDETMARGRLLDQYARMESTAQRANQIAIVSINMFSVPHKTHCERDRDNDKHKSDDAEESPEGAALTHSVIDRRDPRARYAMLLSF